MRIALCLYGYFNNRRNKNAGELGYKYIKSNIMDKASDIDVFIHSWEKDNETYINSLYSPKKSVFENQIDFKEISLEHGIDEDWINQGFERNRTIFRNCTINNSLSFYYSRSKAIELKKLYELENDFTYDCVVICRFDLGYTSTWSHGYNVSLMPFDINLDMEYVYSAMWVQLNAGYADQWFISNSKNADLIGDMYEDSLNDYFQKNSEYYQVLTTNWFDSNINNELSNELISPTNSPNVRYPKWQMINNHILHKWHFYKVGLYEKSKFIGIKK